MLTEGRRLSYDTGVYQTCFETLGLCLNRQNDLKDYFENRLNLGDALDWCRISTRRASDPREVPEWRIKAKPLKNNRLN